MMLIIRVLLVIHQPVSTKTTCAEYMYIIKHSLYINIYIIYNVKYPINVLNETTWLGVYFI